MEHRRRKLQAILNSWNGSSFLLFDINNIRYLTGFRGEEGIFFFHSHRWTLFVDGRFITQAREEVVGEVEIVLVRDVIDDVAQYVRDQGVSSLIVETHALSHDNFRKLRRSLRGIKIKGGSDLVRSMRRCKDGDEIASMKRAVEIAEAALRDVIPLIRPGVKEKDLAVELDYRMKKRGAEQVAFPTIVASGPRSAMPHAKPGLNTLKKGDVVIVDFGAMEEGGYCADETCTFLLGKDEEVMRAYRIVREAQKKAIEAIRPKIKASYVDKVARNIIAKAGYGEFFSHGTGHGIGLEVHEQPRLGPKTPDILEEGMVVTVEPGIYLPGRWGIRLEDMVLVTENGGHLITSMSKEITILD